MVLIYTADAMKVLREYLSNSGQKESSSPLHQLLVPSQLAAAHGQSGALLNWLCSLSQVSRERVLSLHSPSLSAVLLQMYQKRLVLGNFTFSYKTDHSNFPSFEAIFHIHRTSKNTADAVFLPFVRLCDTEHYLDTITLDRDLLKNPELLVESILNACPDAFKYILKDNACPPAMVRKRMTISYFLSIALVQKMWAEFADSCKHSVPKLRIPFWNTLSSRERREVVGDHWQQQLQAVYRKLRPFTIKQIGELSLTSLYRSLETLKADELVQFLTVSTLDRAGSPIDIVARLVFSRIRRRKDSDSETSASSSARDDCFVRDLVLDIVEQAISAKRKRNKKKKQSKQKLSARKSINSSEFPPLGESRLHQEILSYNREIEAKNYARSPLINSVIGHMASIISSVFPGAKLMLFGSYATGLSIETSDIDLQISHPSCSTRSSIQLACELLCSQMSQYGWIFNLQNISCAAIPVLKLEVQLFAFSGDFNDGAVSVDLTFEDEEGRHSGALTLQTTRELLQKHSSLKALIVVLKKILAIHGLNSSYKGGIGSYSLLLWLVAFINYTNKPIHDLGDLLVSFLGFYGNKFDMHSMGINVTNNGSFYRVHDSRSVVTTDPSRPSNNTTRSSYNAQKILSLFSSLHTLACSRKNAKHLLPEMFKSN